MSKRILVVEDQPDHRQIIRDMLAPTDYEITEVESGEEALAAVAKQRPDLILMDIQLPIMDGYTATRKIKADPALLQHEGFRVDSGNKSATGWFLTAHDGDRHRNSIKLQSDGTKIELIVTG
jgi:CheY-like chemotaxis protein